MACMEDVYLKDLESSVFKDKSAVQTVGVVTYVRNVIMELQPHKAALDEVSDSNRSAITALKKWLKLWRPKLSHGEPTPFAIRKAHEQERKALEKAEKKAADQEAKKLKKEEDKKAEALKKAQEKEEAEKRSASWSASRGN